MSRNQQQNQGKYAPKKKDPLRPFYPIIGLLIAGIAGAAAFLGARPLYELIRTNLSPDVAAGLPTVEQMIPVVGVMIFLVIMLLFSLIFALLQPRKQKVTEQSLLKEKQEKERELRLSRERQRTMREKMRKANRDKNYHD